ncbi:MAG: hypothetical protein H0U03_02970 [Actinobacteria bacterium]|nr:hypothetical protein [Actinomycetota bacterium]
MRKRFVLGSLAAAVMAVLAFVGAAVASPPQPVTITVPTTIEPGAVDNFTSNDGVICLSGTVSTEVRHFVGFQSGNQAQILLVKHFVCDAGTFDLLLRATLDFTTSDTVGTWTVIGGTGDYARLHGAGKLTGEGMGAIVLDEYTGTMHID